MTAPPGAALTGLTELAVRARVDAGQVNSVPPAPGRSLAQILRANVLTRFNAILGARPRAAGRGYRHASSLAGLDQVTGRIQGPVGHLGVIHRHQDLVKHRPSLQPR
jgi:hypothetical protein